MSRIVTVLNCAIARFLKQHGYVLLKQAEYDKHNAQVTKTASEQAARAQNLDQDLLALGTEIATKDYAHLAAERAFYSKRVAELEEENRHLTASATKHALRNQKLERAFGGWIPEFEGDDGTVAYAKACGAYVEGTEAPVTEDRLVAPGIANPPGTTVILTFGQSNAGNWCEERYAARRAVHVFNMFDMRFYRAIDPLPGASVDTGCVYGGSVWGRLGDRLVDAGFARSVLFVPIAFGASYIEDWAPGGICNPRLMLALHRLKRAGITVDLLCWHQGEANANHTSMTADEYRDGFRAMLRGVREVGVKAPVYVPLATLCGGAHHPYQNAAEIRCGQKNLISIRDGVLPGPDTDLIGVEHRRDGCHFSASGQELAARAWFKAITAGRFWKRIVWAKYRLRSLFAA